MSNIIGELIFMFYGISFGITWMSLINIFVNGIDSLNFIGLLIGISSTFIFLFSLITRDVNGNKSEGEKDG